MVKENMKYLILFLLCFGIAEASFDEKIQKKVVWGNTEAADSLSDIGFCMSLMFPYLYTKKDPKIVANIAIVQLSTQGLTSVAKKIAKRKRPNGENNESFFSGHTSGSFVSAALTCKLSNRNMCISAISVATLVGYLRMAANKHWFSDVVVGATVGFSAGYAIPSILIKF